jgi:hypothetical protein
MRIRRTGFAPILGAALIGCGLLLSTAGASARGTLTVIQVSGQSTSVSGINDSGVITGAYGGPGHGFLRDIDGTITSFDVPGAEATQGDVINNKRVIAGDYFYSGGNWQPFVRKPDGKIVTYQISGAVDAYSSCINDSGTVAGWYHDDDNVPHGFVRTADGTITTFDLSGAWYLVVSGINAGGSVVGYYAVGEVGHGFIRAADGSITTIDDPDAATETLVTSINDDGVIAGGYDTSEGTGIGFLRATDGTFKTITCPDPDSDCGVSGVNNNQQITGQFYIITKHTDLAFWETSRSRTRTFRAPGEAVRYGITPAKINASGWVAGWFWMKSPKDPKSGHRSPIPAGFLWVP